MASDTTPIQQDVSRPAAPPTSTYGDVTEPRACGFVTLAKEDRDALLEALYAEVSRVRRAIRLGTADAGDNEYLDELLAYIDSQEATEFASPIVDNALDRLEAIQATLLEVQASIERRR